MNLRNRFGAHVRRLRVARGWSQQSLADRCALSVETVRRIEQGHFSPSLETIERLSRGLVVSLRTLFLGMSEDRPRWEDEIVDRLERLRPSQVRTALHVIYALLSPFDD